MTDVITALGGQGGGRIELPSAPTDEATEWVVLPGPTTLAFPTHTEMVARYFAA